MRFGRVISQSDRILMALADGQKHKKEEFGIPLEALNPRLRELKHRGYKILWHGDGSYRLVGGLGENGIHGDGPFRARSIA